MHSEDLLVDDCGNGQAVEAIRERFPQLDIIATFAWVSQMEIRMASFKRLTFVVEAVNSVDGCAFVIASEDEEIFGIFDFVC